mmetsp:Transcript_9442/g.28516  ORF Transcript_9442/g.28516 Transcript_9442/m.28516 type:complete len:330 (+) Transcript_9442:197-1186(+)|eukprot:CAMPEP_0198735290 /NCGR_PEP_ID=MMETSP1475-20131203/58432_1 /TAXON_ID= ORGANISM="Unidentified sp., Strain CCMP1999" /NCGR_SAMPLE_ID=MMETSP1475 /ASSEMBLY_ACC=CAM_ASM_001111 /LENGTH=329 /DNA_ID=CAMNT_0044498919 /DNA_START=117 /DNA_END=1106 /DNA_ORIENTATION=-
MVLLLTKAVGILAAALSACFNGSWAVIAKLPAVAESETDPVLFSLYATSGVALSSWGLFIFHPFAPLLSLAGTIAGFLFVLSLVFSFTAVKLVGVSIAQGVWGGVAILIAFLWGVVGPAPLGHPVHSTVMSLIALILLIGGLLGIVFCKDLSSMLKGNSGEYDQLIAEEGKKPDDAVMNRFAGIASAAVVGLFGGSILVPLAFADEKSRGYGFLTSFGTGTAIATALIGAAYCFNRRQKPTIEPTALVPGLISGVIWNAGNVCQIYALAYARVPYGIAYPLLQCALFVSGFWGIFYFKEIRENKAIQIFFGSGVVLILGAIFLSIFGPQ